MSAEPFDAFWLPGLALPEDQPFRERTFGEGEQRLVVRSPILTPAQLGDLARSVRAARARTLARMPVLEIANLIARAVNRWLDPYSPYQRDAVRWLPAVTGYPEAAIRKGLPALLGGYREEHLRRLLAEELRDPEVLDRFRPRPEAGGLTRAFGPELVGHIFAGNVPGLPAQSLACALLVKAACIGKSASEEPIFPILFARALAEVEPALAEAVAITWWPGGETEIEDALFGEAQAVIAYGGVEAIDALRTRIPPEVRFIPYGHKVSIGLIGWEHLTCRGAERVAAAVAYDVAKYDQQGCLSPQLFYVEAGGEVAPRAFAELLGSALARLESRVPRGRLTPGESSEIARLRRDHEFRASVVPGASLLADSERRWTILYDESPEFVGSCLNRTVQLRAVDRLADALELLGPVRRYLQTAGVAVSPERLTALATRLGELGVDRVCPLGQMPDPSPSWHHDGRPNLLDLLRWTDIEPPNSGGRWEFEHPESGIYGKPVAPAPAGAGWEACPAAARSSRPSRAEEW